MNKNLVVRWYQIEIHLENNFSQLTRILTQVRFNNINAIVNDA